MDLCLLYRTNFHDGMLYVNSELLLFQVHLIESLGASTHSSMVRIGPIAWWLKINMGRFFLSLVIESLQQTQ